MANCGPSEFNCCPEQKRKSKWATFTFLKEYFGFNKS